MNLRPCLSKESNDELQASMDVHSAHAQAQRNTIFTGDKSNISGILPALYRDPQHPYFEFIYEADLALQTKQLAILKKNMTWKTWLRGCSPYDVERTWPGP